MPIPLAPSSATVGTTSSEILAANDKRFGLVINNMSAMTVYLGFGFPAVVNKGIALVPGQAYSADPNNLSQTSVNAIADAAGGSLLLIQEYV